MSSDKKDQYALDGVSSQKEEVHAAIAGHSKGIYPNAACKINGTRVHNFGNITHSDGAGTKTSLAYIYWRETGDMSVWRQIPQDSILMNYEDLICAGAGLNNEDIFLSSVINRNKFRIPGDVVAALIKGQKAFLDRMCKYGINIIGEQGETADVGDLVRTVVIDNTIACNFNLNDVIDNGRIDAGDFVVGLASFGQAAYEDEYNGGQGSNGLTTARHGVLTKKYRWKYPESYAPELCQTKLGNLNWLARLNGLLDSKGLHLKDGFRPYRGTKSLTDLIPVETGELIPVGKLILSPTRTYGPVVKKIKDAGIGPAQISGMVHNTGGGQTKVLNYLSKPLLVVKDNLFEVPALFNLIQKEAKVEWEEMYKDFNMGHRLEIYVKDLAVAEEIIKLSESLGVAAQIVGRVEKFGGDKPAVIIRGPHGNFRYNGR